MEGNEPGRARFFEFLSEEELAEFTEAAELAVFEPGEVLIEEGARPSSLYVLTSGQVEVHKLIPGHTGKVLAVIDASSENAILGDRMARNDETIVKLAARLEDPQSAGEFEVFRDKLMQEWSF